MLEFPNVTKEIRGLIGRRQELNTFLGSVFAALGIFLQNSLSGSLPDSLSGVEEHIFAFYAVMLLAPSLILSLRMARLHGGMTLNGMLYARLMQEQSFTRKGDVERAAAHNWFGVSFLQFLLADVLAAFSAVVLAMSSRAVPLVAFAVGLAVFLAWLGLYFRFHHQAVAFARRKIAGASCEPFTRDDWEEHISECLQDANHGLTATIGFVGLMAFSVFEVMSGLGEIKTHRLPDLRLDQVRAYGAEAYTLLMLATCLIGLITYLRVRVAIGRFSLDLDPTDRPFRPLVLTDSLLGYILLAFFLAVSVHLALVQFVPGLGMTVIVAIDVAVWAAAVLAEQATLVWGARRFGNASLPQEPPPPATPQPIGPDRASEPTSSATAGATPPPAAQGPSG